VPPKIKHSKWVGKFFTFICDFMFIENFDEIAVVDQDPLAANIFIIDFKITIRISLRVILSNCFV